MNTSKVCARYQCVHYSMLTLSKFHLRILTRHSSDSAFSSLDESSLEKQIIGITFKKGYAIRTFNSDHELQIEAGIFDNELFLVRICDFAPCNVWYAYLSMKFENKSILRIRFHDGLIKTFCSSSVILSLQHQNYNLNTHSSYLFHLECRLPCLLPVLNLKKSSL